MARDILYLCTYTLVILLSILSLALNAYHASVFYGRTAPTKDGYFEDRFKISTYVTVSTSYSSVETTQTGLYTTVPTLTRVPVTTELTVTGRCNDGYCMPITYSKRDLVQTGFAPTRTAPPVGTGPTAIPRGEHANAERALVDVANKASNFRWLSGEDDLNNGKFFAKHRGAFVSIALVAAWAGVVLVWAVVHVTLSILKPHSAVNSVMVDFIVLPVFILFALGCLVAGIVQVMLPIIEWSRIYNENVYLAGHVLAWALMGLLAIILVVEFVTFINVRRRNPGMVTAKMSLPALRHLNATRPLGQGVHDEAGMKHDAGGYANSVPYSAQAAASVAPPQAPPHPPPGAPAGQWVFQPHAVTQQHSGNEPYTVSRT